MQGFNSVQPRLVGGITFTRRVADSATDREARTASFADRMKQAPSSRVTSVGDNEPIRVGTAICCIAKQEPAALEWMGMSQELILFALREAALLCENQPEASHLPGIVFNEAKGGWPLPQGVWLSSF